MNLPSDYSAYGDLLLPPSSHIRSFVAVRPGCQPMFQTRTLAHERPDCWISALDGKEHEHKDGKGLHGTRRLGWALWSKQLAGCAAAGAVAVADPLASLLTLILDATDDTCRIGFLEDLLHRYYRETQIYEDCLAQRPAFHLVLIDSEGRHLAPLRRDLQRILRRTGEAAVDIQVRWLKGGDGAGKEILEQALAGHCPIRAEPAHPSAIKLPSLDELQDAVARVERLTASLPDPESGGDGFWDALQKMQNAGGRVPLEPPEPGAGGDIPLRNRPTGLLGARVAVRRFQANPLTLPLAPVTLLMSENASGKTTLMEGLSKLYLGLSRPWLALPLDAEVWAQREPYPSAAGKPLFLEAVSLGDVDPGSVLPLFGDDAKLDEGLLGETVLLSLWPLLIGREPDKAMHREVVVQLARALGDLVDRLELWVDVGRGGIAGVAQGGEIDLGKAVGPRYIHYLSETEREIVQPPANADAQPSDKEPEPTEIERLVEQLRGHRTRFPVPAWLLRENLVDFLKWDLGRGYLPDWDRLAQIDRALGGHPALRRLAASTLAGYAALQRREADAYWRGIEKLVLAAAPVESLERTLGAYFDVGLARFPDHKVRPNTARLVRSGQVARLARWIGAGGIDLPVLLLDEPLLGQDLPASAALLGRYLRLRRKIEAIRWADACKAAGDGESAQTPSLALARSLSQPAMAGGYGPMERSFSRLPPTAVGVSPLAPQLVVASNKPTALAVAAESEGVVLDSAIRATLEALTPCTWRPKLLVALRDARRRYGEDIYRLTAAHWLDNPPAQAMRLYWQAPPGLDRVEEPQRYCKDIGNSLTRLGLHNLRAEAAAVVDGFAGEELETRTAALARRLLRWLVWADLLPAIAHDGDAFFAVSGVATRAIPAGGGMIDEQGPARLRRIGAWLECLPPDLPGEAPPPVPSEAVAATQAPAASGIWYVGAPRELESAELESQVRRAGLRPYRTGGPASTILLHRISNSDWELRTPAGAFIGRSEGDRLAEALAQRRLQDLATRLADGEPVGIALLTHEEGRDPANDLAFVVEGQQLPTDQPEWVESTRKLWEMRISEPLILLRRILALNPRTQTLRFHAFCHPGAAIRAGAIFSHASGFAVECVQNGEPWDLYRQPSYTPPPLTIRELDPPEGPFAEIHLLLSFTRPVEDDYRRWRDSLKDSGSFRAIHLAPEGGPGRYTIAKEGVVDWGEAVFQVLAKAHGSDVKLTRIFCAAPIALAMAIGRSLNACGRIVTMDLPKPSGAGYFASFDFWT